MRVFDDNHIITTSGGLLTASLPFITIGLLNRPIILAIALISGGIGIVGIILGLFLKDNKFLSKAKKIKLQDYFFPYVLALSTYSGAYPFSFQGMNSEEHKSGCSLRF